MKNQSHKSNKYQNRLIARFMREFGQITQAQIFAAAGIFAIGFGLYSILILLNFPISSTIFDIVYIKVGLHSNTTLIALISIGFSILGYIVYDHFR